jgi:hypothetical protein
MNWPHFIFSRIPPLATLTQLPVYDEILHVLMESGWHSEKSNGLGRRYILRTFQGRQETEARILASACDVAMFVIDMEKVVLPPPEDLLDRFLNLPMEIRLALIPAHALNRKGGMIDWVLIRTASRIDLLRLKTERIECLVTDRDGYEHELMPLLAGIMNGRRISTPFDMDNVSSADNLGHWIQHWSSQLGSASGVSPADAEHILWQWIVMLQLTRKLNEVELDDDTPGSQYPAASGIPGYWGFMQYQENADILLTYDSTSATKDLCQLLIDFDRLFTSSCFRPVSEEYLQKLRMLDDTAILDRFRAELMMISRDRFEAETVAWLYTSLEEEQQGWRMEMQGLEPVRKRLKFEGWTVYQPLVCRIPEWGLSHCLLEMDRLARFIQERSDFQKGTLCRELDHVCTQPDLFNPSPSGTDHSGIMDDPASFLVGETMSLKGVDAADEFCVGLIVLLKTLGLIKTYGWEFRGIHTLDHIFQHAS